jgi:hypothetical protein
MWKNDEPFEHLLRNAIEVFDNLPGRRGVDESLLSSIGAEIDCKLPPIYRRLMLEDGDRLANVQPISHPTNLCKNRREAEVILCEKISIR